MKLLLTVLSVLSGWSLLAALAIGLLQILNPLKGVRRSMEKIAMGVRAIEQETAPLSQGADRLVAGLTQTGGGLGMIATHLAALAQDLDGVAAVLRIR